MLIYKNNLEYFIFIHIPKNAGKHIRSTLTYNKNNTIIKSYWGVKNNKLDLAHIPYILINSFLSELNINCDNLNDNLNNNFKINYFTYSRNPYDRIISAFFYKNGKKNIIDLNNFIKDILINFNFSMDFNSNIIHYYPQYLFLIDSNKKINNVKVEKINTKKYELKNYLNNDSIKIINKIYEKDFILLDYSFIESI